MGQSSKVLKKGQNPKADKQAYHHQVLLCTRRYQFFFWSNETPLLVYQKTVVLVHTGQAFGNLESIDSPAPRPPTLVHPKIIPKSS